MSTPGQSPLRTPFLFLAEALVFSFAGSALVADDESAVRVAAAIAGEPRLSWWLPKQFSIGSKK